MLGALALAAIASAQGIGGISDRVQGSGRVEQRRLLTAEQYFDILRSDRSSPKQWLEAAEGLTTRRDPLRPILLGDSLRARHEREVDDLLARRADQMTMQVQTRNTQSLYDLANGLRVAHALYVWSARDSLATLRRVSDRTLRVTRDWSSGRESINDIVDAPYAEVLGDRMLLGDRQAFDLFADYADQMNLSDGLNPANLKPLWMLPNNSTVQRVGADFFKRVGRRFSSDGPDAANTANITATLIGSPMIKVPAFREFLAQSLRVGNVIGTARLSIKDNRGSVTYKAGRSSGTRGLAANLSFNDFDRNEVRVSIGDYLAQELSFLPSAPMFYLAWNANRRDRARQDMAYWLRDRSVNWDRVAAGSAGK
jgi:hypothetical protein